MNQRSLPLPLVVVCLTVLELLRSHIFSSPVVRSMITPTLLPDCLTRDGYFRIEMVNAVGHWIVK
jgi:hypothetical protein